MRLHRLVTEGHKVLTMIRTTNGKEITLSPTEVKALREILRKWDEESEPQMGDPFVFAQKRLPDGEIITHYDGTATRPLTEEEIKKIAPTFYQDEIKRLLKGD